MSTFDRDKAFFRGMRNGFFWGIIPCGVFFAMGDYSPGGGGPFWLFGVVLLAAWMLIAGWVRMGQEKAAHQKELSGDAG